MEELKDYLNVDYVIKNDTYKSLEFSVICLICQNILIKPVTCTTCKTSYCKQCIERWNLDKKDKKKCPFYSHEKPVYQKNPEICKILSKLQFQCKNCKDIIDYDKMITHFYSKCGTENLDDKAKNIENTLEYKGIFEKKEINKLNGQEEPIIKINSKYFF